MLQQDSKKHDELRDDMPHAIWLVLEAHSSVFQTLLGLPPSCELDYAIELLSGTTSINV